MTFILGALLFAACQISVLVSLTFGYRLVCNHLGRHPVVHTTGEPLGFGIAFLMAMIPAIIVFFVSEKLLLPLRIAFCILGGPLAVASVVALVFGLVYANWLVRASYAGAANAICAIAAHLCPPRDPGDWDDEHDPM